MGLLLTLFFLGNLDVQIISPILPALTESFDVTVLLAGISVSAYSISGAFWALIVGPLSDRHGRIIFLRIAAICFGLASAIAFLASEFGYFIFARALAGFAGGTFTACIIAQVADLFPYGRRGRAMGLVGAVYSLAAVVGVPVGAIVASNYGWRMIYLFFGIIAIIMAALLTGKFQKLATAQSELIDPSKSSNGHQVTGFGKMVSRQILEYLHFWANGKTRNGLILAVAIAATSTSLMTYLGAWLADDFSLQGTGFALVFLAAGLSTVIGSLVGGILADKIGKPALVAISSIAVALVLLTTSFIQSIFAVYAFCIAGGLFLALRQGPYEALLTELVPSHRRGAYIAMRSTTAKLAIAAAVAIAGFLYQSSGFPAVTAFASATSLLAAAMIFFALRHISQSPQSIPFSKQDIPAKNQISPTSLPGRKGDWQAK
jgi:predicted MFS family arabinose efflux permease